MDPLYVENLSRACLNCGIVKTFAEFFYEGCPNCESFMHLKNNAEKVMYCTSNSYFSLCLLPEGSHDWGTSLIHVETFAFGTYALLVSGRIPFNILHDLLSEDRASENRGRGA